MARTNSRPSQNYLITIYSSKECFVKYIIYKILKVVIVKYEKFSQLKVVHEEEKRGKTPKSVVVMITPSHLPCLMPW